MADQLDVETIAPDVIERTFNAVVDKMKLIAIALDSNGHLRYCNDFFLSLTGWTHAEVKGCDYFQRFVPKDLDDIRGVFDDALRDCPDTWHHENEILTSSGRRLLIHWNNSVIRDNSGNAIGVASIGQDITDRCQLEALLLAEETHERRQLAAELHDGLGQVLYGARLLIEGLEKSARKTRSPIERDLTHLATVIDSSITTCRQIARGLSPLSDVSGDISSALRTLVSVPTRSGTAVVLHITGDPTARVTASVADHLYRIAQEALANALKHAYATLIEIRLEILPYLVTLSVTDNGIGIAASLDKSDGLGLKLMKHRADIIHAKLSITRQLTQGTQVLCVSPQLNSGT
ncbi:MAG TPA: PAS domain S-box protein [Xanthobacteraceae bacterium]